ncbi:hypothetical protein PIB30_025080 [Stylosanthes scabra]|uniref:Secreted protein n=1 Tax=Stylosanthes scabra TaxID=79078 RepID=A0ABU6UC10_9FABA|nr:hypothetical protein [Stylosanthes scabra]
MAAASSSSFSLNHLLFFCCGSVCLCVVTHNQRGGRNFHVGRRRKQHSAVITKRVSPFTLHPCAHFIPSPLLPHFPLSFLRFPFLSTTHSSPLLSLSPPSILKSNSNSSPFTTTSFNQP